MKIRETLKVYFPDISNKFLTLRRLLHEKNEKVTVFGSFVVDLMARVPHIPIPGETLASSFFKMGPEEKP